MIGLDYFLDDKWFQKSVETLKNDRYFSTLPATVRRVYSWSFRQNVFDDKYLYDYIHAYKVKKGTGTVETFHFLEVISILKLDGNLKKENFYNLYKKLERINNGAKPSNYEERLLANVLEIYDLIYQKKFPLNEENFELIVHILFRNLGYDLDLKQTYKRTASTKSDFKGLIDPSLIDNELQNLWSYLDKPKSNQFSGFTQGLMIGMEMLYISPFDSLNLVLAQFMIKWYLFQLDQNFHGFNFCYLLGVNYDAFVEIVNESFSRNLNLDDYMKIMKKMAKDQANMKWKFDRMIKQVKASPELSKLSGDVSLDVYVARLLSIEERQFNYTTIKKALFFKEELTNKKAYNEFMNTLIKLGLIEKKKKNGSFVYEFKDLRFEKTRMLLTD